MNNTRQRRTPIIPSSSSSSSSSSSVLLLYRSFHSNQELWENSSYLKSSEVIWHVLGVKMHLSTLIKHTMGKMKSVPHSDGPTHNNHPTLRFPYTSRGFFLSGQEIDEPQHSYSWGCLHFGGRHKWSEWQRSVWEETGGQRDWSRSPNEWYRY